MIRQQESNVRTTFALIVLLFSILFLFPDIVRRMHLSRCYYIKNTKDLYYDVSRHAGMVVGNVLFILSTACNVCCCCAGN
jgi:hypothetical protein